MNLFNEKLIKKFEEYPLDSQYGKMGDAKVIAKLFDPTGAGTWLITEGDIVRDENNKIVDVEMFGFINLVGLVDAELGYISLRELQEVKLPFGLTIEQDLYFPKDITMREACKKEFNAIPDIFSEKVKVDIYQLKNIPRNYLLKFTDYDTAMKAKANENRWNEPEIADYDCVYTLNMPFEGEKFDINNDNDITSILNSVYLKFNTDIPRTFIGHSLSVSDIVVISTPEESKAYYCDRIGFRDVTSKAFCDKKFNLLLRIHNLPSPLVDDIRDYFKINESVNDKDVELFGLSTNQLFNNPVDCRAVKNIMYDWISQHTTDLEVALEKGIITKHEFSNWLQYESHIIENLADELGDYSDTLAPAEIQQEVESEIEKE